MKLNGFDSVAFLYDKLARVVYGKSIIESQRHFLPYLPERAKILILGGGTGWILQELLNVNPTCEIWYIEASQKMLKLSKKSIGSNNVVHFIHGTEQHIPAGIMFDAVVTNFYLDLFTEESLASVIKKISVNLRNNACWLATDFVSTGKWWQTILLKVMYAFFRKICGIESKKLPDWNTALSSNGLKRLQSKTFYHGFIESTLYQVVRK